MIASFARKDVEEYYLSGPSKRTRRIPSNLRNTVLKKLVYVEAAKTLNDLRQPPGNRLEALKGGMKGFHCIRVNDQFRIIFRWENDAAHDVDVVDYH